MAGGLVFSTSAAILVLEILAGRLLAPYVGITLETYTAVIGTVLAGIAAGTWGGGYLADRVDPRAMLGPLLVAGGALAMATVPLVRLFGGEVSGEGGSSVVGLSLTAFFAPAAVLSAVTPTVIKLQLRDLAVTGRVVGRLSALGTTGAIIGTFVAGFVLVEAAPTTASVLVTGGVLVVAGAILWVWLGFGSRRGTTAPIVALVLVLGGGAVAGAAAGNPCQVETAYHCIQVEQDGTRPGGRALIMDTLRHSYVDLDDPTHLELPYTRVFADAIAAEAPPGPLRVAHIGGGGFTLPRYIGAVRPGSTNVVLEVDSGLVEVARDRLGLRTGPDIEVRTGDARLLIGSVPRSGLDLVLGDAFGGVAVPWHLTTVEFVEAVRSTLRPGGVYLLNLIDRPPLRFAKAEAATLLRVFSHVAVVAPPGVIDSRDRGNLVLAASDAPLDAERIGALTVARGGDEQILADEEAAAFAGGAAVLTDDYAPVDQWLARARR